MKRTVLLIVILTFIFFRTFSQTINEIKVILLPPDSNAICISNCADCGKLIFYTSIAGLNFESQMGNVKEITKDSVIYSNNATTFTYKVVTFARDISVQHIIITGSYLAPYSLKIQDLKPLGCQKFKINSAPPKTGSVIFNISPGGSYLKINNMQGFEVDSSFFWRNQKVGAYRVHIEKALYYPIDTLAIVLPDTTFSLNIKLRSIIKDSGRGSVIEHDVKPEGWEEYMQKEIQKQSRKETYWLISGIIAAGAGGYLMYESDLKYKEYLKASNSTADRLHQIVELYDILGPALLGVAGFCTLEFTFHIIKKSRLNHLLDVHMNPKEAKLTYKF